MKIMKNNNDFFGNDKPKVEQAVYFIGEGQDYHVNPIYNLDETPNTPNRFVILKTTANGKFCIDNMIHYRINDWDLITDSDNAIFVDKINKTVFIREYGRTLREIAPEDPEQRQYVILIYDLSDEEFNEWVALEGRTQAYEYIKSHAYTMDVTKSIVLTENVALKDALTVSQFVHFLKNGDIVEDDGFYIEEFEEEAFD
jgi:hypothetical protein